jgi:S1-C subfamily serine protease
MDTQASSGSRYLLRLILQGAVAAVIMALPVRGADAGEQPAAEAVAGGPTGALAEELSDIEKRTIRIYESCSPGVVSVANKAMVQDWYSMRVYQIPQGTGSGFVWDKQGHVITNYHVIHEAAEIQVTLRDGASYEAVVVGADPDHDVAVLRIQAPEAALVPIPVGASRSLRVGQTVLAIGNPFGLDTSLSVGVVSALGRTIEAMTGRSIREVVQTDAAINPGNSGGPLLDSSGRLIGINTAIISPSGSYAGVGFAVPVDTVRRIVPELIEHGKVQRVGLGIEMIPDHIMASMQVEGVGIMRAVPGGGAAKAGLEGVRRTAHGGAVLGDVIVAIGKVPVKSIDDLAAALDQYQPGDEVEVAIRRGKKRYTVTIALQLVN